jgi:hypothetical protein
MAYSDVTNAIMLKPEHLVLLTPKPSMVSAHCNTNYENHLP